MTIISILPLFDIWEDRVVFIPQSVIMERRRLLERGNCIEK